MMGKKSNLFFRILSALLVGHFLLPPPSFGTVQVESVQQRVLRLEPISLKAGEQSVSQRLLGGTYQNLPWGRFTSKTVTKAEMLQSVTSKFSGAVANSFVETGRAALMIWVVTCMATLDTMEKEYKIRQIKFDKNTLKESIKICSNVLINSGEIHAGMFGGGAIETVLHYPLKAFDTILASAAAKSAFAQVFSSMVHSTIICLSFSFFGQLFTEARELLSDSDYRRSEEVWNLYLSSIRAKMDGKRATQFDQDGFRILQRILSNMVLIALYDDQLRDLWIYNANRLTVFTSDNLMMILALTGSSVLGGTVGTAIQAVVPIPGVPIAVGMIFGALGGYAVYKTDQKIKDLCNLVMRGGGFTLESVAAARDEFLLNEIISSGDKGNYARRNHTLADVLLRKRKSREHRLDTLIGSYELLRAQTLKQREKIELARLAQSNKNVAKEAPWFVRRLTGNHSNEEIIRENQYYLKRYEMALKFFSNKIFSFYNDELQNLEKIVHRPDAELSNPLETKLEIRNEMITLRFSQSTIRAVIESLQNPTDEEKVAQAEATFTKFHMRGFSEAEIANIASKTLANGSPELKEKV